MGLFIKFDGIDGECQEKGFEKWSLLDSVSGDMSRPGFGTTGAPKVSGHVTINDIVCTKVYDKSSPRLAERVCTGKVTPKVEIHVTSSYAEGTHTPYLKITLEEVLITHFSHSGGIDSRPHESIALNFEKITYDYSAFDGGERKDNAKFTWDVKKNTSG